MQTRADRRQARRLTISNLSFGHQPIITSSRKGYSLLPPNPNPFSYSPVSGARPCQIIYADAQCVVFSVSFCTTQWQRRLRLPEVKCKFIHPHGKLILIISAQKVFLCSSTGASIIAITAQHLTKQWSRCSRYRDMWIWRTILPGQGERYGPRRL